jgi:two-component system, chemotaxis family, chemotaxis protein CheY
MSSPLSILVADDDEPIRALLRHYFTTGGHTVFCVGSANEAAKFVGKVRFDLVVTDMLMPDGDGAELIRAVKAAQPDARILAISGGGRYVRGDDALKIAKGFGADAIVMKPFDREQLLAGVTTALAAKAAVR